MRHGPADAAQRLSPALRLIRKLPFGRRLALRLYNRTLMHFFPRRNCQTYFGARVPCDVRDMIQATIMHFGAWEPAMSRLFEQLIRPGTVAVDVGSNIGYYAMLFSKRVGPTGSVVAIEALPRLAGTITATLAANKIDNVRVVNAAVVAAPGPVTIYEAPRTNVGMTTIRPEAGYPAAATVPGLPLLHLLTPAEAARTSLIKIDIEGAEVPVTREILQSADRLPSLVAVAVEADVAKNSEWPDLLATAQASGWEVWEFHNSYDWVEMLDERTEAPQKFDGFMAKPVVDLLLIRPGEHPWLKGTSDVTST